MQAIDLWKPTKFIVKRGKIQPSKDPRELAVSSRLSASVVTDAYNRHFLQHCSGKLLDLGCGKAPFYEFYKNHVTDNTCVDWDNSGHGTQHVDIACDLSNSVPLPDAEFDTILLSSVLEHIPEPMNVWNEMSRLLKPGGKAVINVPFLYWLHETPHDFYRYTEFVLRRMAEQSGFDMVLLEPLGGAPIVLGDITSKLCGRMPFIGGMLAHTIYYSCRMVLSIPIAKRAAIRSARLFPAGYFLVAEKRRAA